MARLLIRQRHNIVAHRTRRHVDVAPLSRSDGSVITLDPQTFSLEATGQVAQRACINQLTDKTRTRLGEGTHEVDEAEGIEAKPRHVRVVYEVIALLLQLVVRVPVAPDSQDGLRRFLDGDHVGDSNLVLRLVLGILVIWEHEVNVHLQQFVAVVTRRAEAHFLRDGLLNLIEAIDRVIHLDFAVEAFCLQLLEFIRRFTHHVSDALCRLKVGRAVRHHHILGGDIHSRLAAKARIVVDLLEGVARQAQTPQHPLVLGPILRHDVGELVVHIRLHALGGVTGFGGLFTDDLRPHRALGRERLHHGLSLELDQSFRQERVVHTAGTGPRLGAILDLHTQQLKTVYIRLYPVLAAADVLVELTQQVSCQLSQLTLVHVLGKVVVKPRRRVVLFSLVVLVELDLNLDLRIVRLSILLVDVQRRLHSSQASGGGVKGLVDCHGYAFLRVARTSVVATPTTGFSEAATPAAVSATSATSLRTPSRPPLLMELAAATASANGTPASRASLKATFCLSFHFDHWVLPMGNSALTSVISNTPACVSF